MSSSPIIRALFVVTVLLGMLCSLAGAISLGALSVICEHDQTQLITNT
jgi:hypothetical protein